MNDYEYKNMDSKEVLERMHPWDGTGLSTELGFKDLKREDSKAFIKGMVTAYEDIAKYQPFHLKDQSITGENHRLFSLVKEMGEEAKEKLCEHLYWTMEAILVHFLKYEPKPEAADKPTKE